MRKSIIAAMSSNGIIGNNGKLPWNKLPGDLPRFKRLTMGKPCIMGRKTCEGLPKLLQGRTNIVVSKNGYHRNGAITVPSILEAWIIAAEQKHDEAFVIGGGEVYKQALQSSDRVYLTITDQEFSGDVSLELPSLADWTITDRQYIDGLIPYQNLILDRKEKSMVQFLTLERLPDNSLPSPRYGTALSAGIDFAACLTRTCKTVEDGTGNKKDFWVVSNDDIPYGRAYSKPEPAANQSDTKLSLVISPGETVLVPLGFKSSFDACSVLNIYPRSSVGLRGIVLANGTGIIDPDYRGELFVALHNRSSKAIVIKHGERIVQGILTHFSQGIVREGPVDETVRGEGGLGSTGQMVEALNVLKQAAVMGLLPE